MFSSKCGTTPAISAQQSRGVLVVCVVCGVVTGGVTFVLALHIAPPTQMESTTCIYCKQECTDWERLISIVIWPGHAAVSFRDV